ncbi:alpha-1,2-mannosyltransferase ALG9 [Adelges cooleyi]|uniref:alpha-1,2-mannosyltransferase ALG9 n=1 Tax=Adelges cooleyi TaxID=133065 RepID=UPI0021809376|nr:alpha-1,2-mannosyltransferase ALG9 [Adelges cooleyi]
MPPKLSNIKKANMKRKAVKNKTNEEIGSTETWLMSFDAPFKIILSARFFAAFLVHITDCDETFNYWEPTHYFMFKSGFQTWEYSPTYALRSYLYILMHAVPVYLYQSIFSTRKLMLFYMVRCMLALICSFCEIYFYRVLHQKFGSYLAKYYLIISVFSPGMFIASAAYLPSSFSMYMTFLSIGAWYSDNFEFAIFTTAISTFLSWPFSGLIGFPLACDIVLRQKKYGLFIKWCLISLASILTYQIAIDSYLYGKVVIAPFNIVFYNIFTSHGPDIYGTEHWSFYIYNGILNFNVAFILVIIAPFLVILNKILSITGCRVLKQYKNNKQINKWILYLSPLYLWMTIFIVQPHKEERFLFPVYPLISLASAVILQYTISLLLHVFNLYVLNCSNVLGKLKILGYTCFFVFFILTGLSRSALLIKAYHAPLDIYKELSNESLILPKSDVINVCVGKEWHRYPSSFFLPDYRWKMHFIRSEFRGLLPGRFHNDSMSKVKENYNDQNKEEPDKYSDIRLCHFMIDLDNDQSSDLEPNYSKESEWIIVKSLPFLNHQKTPLLFRVFYIPFFWEDKAHFSSYNLLMRKSKENANSQSTKSSPIYYAF